LLEEIWVSARSRWLKIQVDPDFKLYNKIIVKDLEDKLITS
jgi:hypothetical protein